MRGVFSPSKRVLLTTHRNVQQFAFPALFLLPPLTFRLNDHCRSIQSQSMLAGVRHMSISDSGTTQRQQRQQQQQQQQKQTRGQPSRPPKFMIVRQRGKKRTQQTSTQTAQYKGWARMLQTHAQWYAESKRIVGYLHANHFYLTTGYV